MKVGFAGAGNIAAAMARGWTRSESGPDAMLFSDAGSGRAATLAAEVGGEARPSLSELAGESDLVVLAVKPAALEPAARAMEGRANAVLSVLAATTLDRLREEFPDPPLFRTMPNLAVEVRRGVIVSAHPDGAEASLAASVNALLGELGLAVEVAERLIDAATAVSGCSPAYFALAAEALADAGVREGLDAGLAQGLVAETLAGTGELLRERDTLSIRRAVASPGGSTAAGLAALERGAVRAAFADAVRASLDRMRG
jgi:pyrroline-5-carboxylate reductase